MNVKELHEKKYLGTTSAAKVTGVSPSTLRRWANRGRLRHLKTATGRMLFCPADLERLKPVEFPYIGGFPDRGSE